MAAADAEDEEEAYELAMLLGSSTASGLNRPAARR